VLEHRSEMVANARNANYQSSNDPFRGSKVAFREAIAVIGVHCDLDERGMEEIGYRSCIKKDAARVI